MEVFKLDKKQSEFACLVCNGVNFRKGYYEAEYERYDEYVRMNEDREAKIRFLLESEEQNELAKIPVQSKHFSYICEDCGYIMNFNKEKQVESKKQERLRKQKEKMYDWTKFKK